ncbi:MAG: Putative metal chaperone, involved in Zn homeostasis, GTPase of COG0523 family [uncultured Sulfurovum sp.]|uniref:Metal chaperone, involved in Zn homeostasis, GTPase of COG0523 family n=1 Tax=uncultured Sulfurovum sp. TaxID=269237 RepID=A0A6S6T5L3_9BACT|nr:MAG: Putative metal chaperone, involved in Zn homeostasis, GTPase of COG0523 family [uncultured Sulfurovum sp.]
MIHSFILTGFLGVGKTTMLTNTVKQHFSDKKIAIIVNEFGDVGIDSKILTNVHSEVLEISEGCICCKLSEEFESGVIEIINKYNPEIIFVETSGASEPFPIFLSLQNLGISVEGIICVVDAKNFDSYKDNSTAKYQLGGSNILVLNKTDLVTENELQSLKQDVVEIKEQYNIKNNLTGKAIFNHYIVREAEQGIVGKEAFEGVYEIDEITDIAKDYKHHDHTSKDSITQQVVYLKEDITFDNIDTLLKSLPQNIYRVKGVIKTTDVPEPLFINYSFGDASFEALANYEERSILIFIGESIEKDMTKLNKKFSFINIPQFRLNR